MGSSISRDEAEAAIVTKQHHRRGKKQKDSVPPTQETSSLQTANAAESGTNVEPHLQATPKTGSTSKMMLMKQQQQNGGHFQNGSSAAEKAAQEAAPPQARDDEVNAVSPQHQRHQSQLSPQVSPHHFVNDDQVQVNLAMADLMAYLQVVANNSNSLPITRRDDPEVGRTVSSLTAEEYARKSAAFIPANVRVIGGSFTKYGRVWDLPTSEEYIASDGAQEPGRSYGGACCNAMLKVLYDAANEAADAAQAAAVTEALFDDDDEEEASLEKSTGGSLVLGDVSTPTTITWAALLRKMKAEIKEIEYAQAPVITSSRKFDLNKAFSLIPDNFDPKKGKKRSLLIGCNYKDVAGAELKASHDDIRSMKDYIVNVHGFPESKGLMTVLLDDDVHQAPTHKNITEAFKALSEQSLPGDAVFIQFSGHGGRVLDSTIDTEAESYDEVIVPSDYSNSGLIRDTLIFKTLLAPMRYGVTLTILIDCCDTGMVLDLPYSWTTKTDRSETIAKMSWNDDFSFVRFLKVVKTLYEASTFTQLGKTVGSALNTPVVHGSEETEDDTMGGNGSMLTIDEEETDAGGKVDKQKGGFLEALTLCTSPVRANGRDNGKNSKRKGLKNEKNTVDTRETRTGAPSLLEQVINCTLGHDEEDWDDETYKSRNDEIQSSDTQTTFDSATDDGYDARGRRAGGKPRKHR